MATGNSSDDKILSSFEEENSVPKKTTHVFPILIPEKLSGKPGESYANIHPSKPRERELPPSNEKILPLTQETEFPCPACGKKFTTKRGRTTHMSKKHEVAAKQKLTVEEVTSQLHGNLVPRPQPQTNHIWGNHTKDDIYQIFQAMYNEIVLWRRNVFLVPSGANGKRFVSETTKWLQRWVDDSESYKDIALTVVMVMPALLLQKPSYKSTAKQHSLCLERRFRLWDEGDFDALMRESRTIQKALKTYPNKQRDAQFSKTFAKLVFMGKINAALKMLDKHEGGGVLNLSNDVINSLKSKHPEAQEADKSVLIHGPKPFVDPVVFESINESTIVKSALRTKGSSGPSGLDSDAWRRMLVSKNFGKFGSDLQKTLVAFAKKLCKENIETNGTSSSLEAYTSCRLIPLDKSPGVRPIGIGEVLRRIVGKAVISVIKPNILESAGELQLCAGQKSGCEAAVHAMRDIFNEEETDGLLLVDARNAFNSINRKVLLHNMPYLCPVLATYVSNCYKVPSRLFVQGGLEISSTEGTTQGDPMSMPSYAIGILPLMDAINNVEPVQQAAFADDLGGAGKLNRLREWWGKVVSFGPSFGYYPEPSKSWLIVKENMLEKARKIFEGTDIKLTTSGRKYLGGFIGIAEGKDAYVNGLVQQWCAQLKVLCDVAKSEPQAAYVAFVAGFKHKLTYHIRTIPDMHQYLAPFDLILDTIFIPAITDGHHCSVDERLLLSLPPKKGSLSIHIFTTWSMTEFSNSQKVTSNLSSR